MGRGAEAQAGNDSSNRPALRLLSAGTSVRSRFQGKGPRGRGGNWGRRGRGPAVKLEHHGGGPPAHASPSRRRGRAAIAPPQSAVERLVDALKDPQVTRQCLFKEGQMKDLDDVMNVARLSFTPAERTQICSCGDEIHTKVVNGATLVKLKAPWRGKNTYNLPEQLVCSTQCVTQAWQTTGITVEFATIFYDAEQEILRTCPLGTMPWPDAHWVVCVSTKALIAAKMMFDQHVDESWSIVPSKKAGASAGVHFPYRAILWVRVQEENPVPDGWEPPEGAWKKRRI